MAPMTRYAWSLAPVSCPSPTRNSPPTATAKTLSSTHAPTVVAPGVDQGGPRAHEAPAGEHGQGVANGPADQKADQEVHGSVATASAQSVYVATTSSQSAWLATRSAQLCPSTAS